MLNSSQQNKAEFIQESHSNAENNVQLCVAELTSVKKLRKYRLTNNRCTHIPLYITRSFLFV